MRSGIGVALLATATLVAGVSVAQEPAPPFPVVNDLPEGWDMGGAEMPVDILGVKIGMSREDAVRTAATAMEADPTTGRWQSQETGIGDQYGTQVFFRHDYLWQLTTNFGSREVASDLLSLYFTPGTSGERLAAFNRVTTWPGGGGLEPRLPDVEKVLIEKYGPPSYRQSSHFYWAYHNGQKVEINDANFDFFRKVRRSLDTPEACMSQNTGAVHYAYEEVPSPHSTLKRRGDEALKKDCNVVLFVKLNPGSSAGLVGSMEIHISAPKRIYENSVTTDAFLDKALEDAAAASSGPSTAPKL